MWLFEPITDDWLLEQGGYTYDDDDLIRVCFHLNDGTEMPGDYRGEEICLYKENATEWTFAIREYGDPWRLGFGTFTTRRDVINLFDVVFSRDRKGDLCDKR